MIGILKKTSNVMTYLRAAFCQCLQIGQVPEVDS